MSKSVTVIKKSIPFVVSLLVLYFVFRNTSFHQVLSSLHSASIPWVFAYFALAAFEPVIRGGRWHLLLGQGSRSIAVKGLYIAKAGNNLLPLRLGDVIRTQYVNDKDGIPYSVAFPSIFSEVFLDLFALAIIAIVYSLVDPSFSTFSYFLLSGLIVVGAGIYVIGNIDIVNKYSGTNRLLLVLKKILTSIFESFSANSIIPILIYTVLLWSYTLFMTYAGLKMILPEVSIQGVLATIVFTYLTATIPSAPGFVGTYHAAIAAGILVMGYSMSNYPAVPILIHIMQYIPQTVTGLIIGFSYLFHNDWSKLKYEFGKGKDK